MVDINQRPLQSVSVVMNCYNGAKHLREAIDSVYAQTYENWEIIFWDNASTDTSAEIAKTYDSKLRYFRGEKTIPLGAARSKALEQCNGQYIAFLDVDDLWLPQKLEVQVQEMQENPESIVCYSDGYDMYDEEKSPKKFSSYPNVKIFEGDVFNKLIISNFINWQTVLINKELAVGNLYFNEELNFAEDHELLLRLSLQGKVSFSPEPLIYYRLHENNMSHDISMIIRESKLIYHIFRKEISIRGININKARARLYGTVVMKAIRNREDYRQYSNYLLQYPNFQNIIVFVLIKLRMVFLFNIMLRGYPTKA